MKKTLSLLLALCLMLALLPLAAYADQDTACAVIGADLTNEQTASVYATFGVERGSVRELSMTNAEERGYLEGLVDSSIIGTNSISCVYLTLLDAGSGIQLSVSNITWCTPEMYRAALQTAGINDVAVTITAPFEVSGTAALAGIYKAYEALTGETIDDIVKQVSTQELITTAELADELGKYDAAFLVGELKGVLADTKNMSDAELTETVRSLADQYHVAVTDKQIQQLISLCRKLEGLDDTALTEKVQQVKDTVQKVQDAGEKMHKVADTFKTVSYTVKTVFVKITDFFSGLFGKKG